MARERKRSDISKGPDRRAGADEPAAAREDEVPERAERVPTDEAGGKRGGKPGERATVGREPDAAAERGAAKLRGLDRPALGARVRPPNLPSLPGASLHRPDGAATHFPGLAARKHRKR